MVNAAILKGRSTNQMMGNNTSTSKAMGQQQMNKKHQRIRAISVRMGNSKIVFPAYYK